MRISMNCLGISLALVLGAAGCAAEEDTDLSSTLTIDNDSSFSMIEINLSPTDRIAWGPDLLGTEVLDPGDSFIVSDLDCGVYDIRLVDEDNDECIMTDIDLCLENAVWRLDDAELLACQF